MHPFFQDDDFDFATRNVLGGVFRRAADVGEVLTTVERIHDGTARSWVDEDNGDRTSFGKQMAWGAKFSPRTRATMAVRMRPYGTTSPFDFFSAARAYRIAEDGVARITCPVLVTDPGDEQFWPGESQRLHDMLPGPRAIVRFTAAAGADVHCEPVATGLRGERVFDWLDHQVPA
jgi:hypothetical protein